MSFCDQLFVSLVSVPNLFCMHSLDALKAMEEVCHLSFHAGFVFACSFEILTRWQAMVEVCFSCSNIYVFHELVSNPSFFCLAGYGGGMWCHSFSFSILLIPPHGFSFKNSHCAVQAMEVVEVVATMTVEADTVAEEAVGMVAAVEDTAEVAATRAEVEDAEAATVARVEVVVRARTMHNASHFNSVLMLSFNI